MTTNENEFIRFNTLITASNPGYEPYYFPLNQNSKDPIEGISWKNNRLTFEQAKEKLSKGFNIGIAATDKDQLVIMDKDDLEKVGPSKPTLTVTSRKRTGRHCFYITDDPLSKSIFDNSAKQNIATEDYGEIRANWQYVVCAGSYVPVTPEELENIPENDRINAGKYTVSEELPVNIITYDELPQVYKDCLNEKRENEIKVKINKEQKPQQASRDGLKSALYNLSIQDVTGKNESGTKRFSSLFHGSDTGKNTSISKGLLHCWRHNVSHTPLTALAVISGIGSCGNVGYGHNGSGTSSLDLNDGETIFKLWEYAKKEGIISKDDPIPSKALVWYAVKNKICESSQIKDGWKLSPKAYNQTIESLSSVGVSAGREPIQYTRAHNNNNGNNKFDDEYHHTDLGYAQHLKAMHGNDFHFCRAFDKFLVYDGNIWNDDKYAQMESYVRELYNVLWEEAQAIQDWEKRKDAISLVLKAESAHKMSSILQMVKSEPGIPIAPDAFDKDPWLFNVQNGTIDLRTGTLRPHTKADYITKISPVIYNPDAKCPTWLKFLDKIFQGNQNIIEYLQRRNGYILTGDAREEDFTILWGPGGNGKSKYTGAISYIMGDYFKKVNVETIQETYKNSGSSASSDVARLKSARYITVSEPEKGIQLNEARVKDWTGRDPITARQLYQEPFTFEPEFKMDIYTNHKPRIKGQDTGIWRRVKFIPFEVKIPEGEKDLQLDQKLRAEASGILNWMIEGCLKWQKYGLQTPKEILQATEEYKEDQDYLGAFFRDCCEINPERITPLKWIFFVYQAYCRIKGLTQQNHMTFPQTLEEKGYKKVRQNSGQFFRGIGLKPALATQCINMETQPGGLSSVGVQAVQDFLISFLETPTYRDLPEKPTQPYTSARHSENLSDSVGYENIPKNAINYEEFDRVGEDFIERFGPININTINQFTMYFKEHSNTNLTPSEIKIIAMKIFKITPEP